MFGGREMNIRIQSHEMYYDRDDGHKRTRSMVPKVNAHAALVRYFTVNIL